MTRHETLDHPHFLHRPSAALRRRMQNNLHKHKRENDIMWLNRVSVVLLVILSSLTIACDRSPVQQAQSPTTTSSSVDRSDFTAEKGTATDKGLVDAQHDIEALKKVLKTKSPDELVGSFIPDASPKSFGGYDYYYKYMANIEVRRELESRGITAELALKRHVDDQTRIWEAVNGPGDTVGRICKELLARLPRSQDE